MRRPSPPNTSRQCKSAGPKCCSNLPNIQRNPNGSILLYLVTLTRQVSQCFNCNQRAVEPTQHGHHTHHWRQEPAPLSGCRSGIHGWFCTSRLNKASVRGFPGSLQMLAPGTYSNHFNGQCPSTMQPTWRYSFHSSMQCPSTILKTCKKDLCREVCRHKRFGLHNQIGD